MQAWDVDLLTATYAMKTGHYPGDLPPELADRVPHDGRSVEVGRFEHLRDDFLSFLERHEVPAPAEFVEAVRASPPRHGSRAAHTRTTTTTTCGNSSPATPGT